MNGLIILLCRNTLTLSRRCLQTLLAQTAPVNILVVDNASTDGTGKYMGSLQANIYRMTFPAVTSVARCWNEGLQWGWSRGHMEALVVNADTELLPNTYKLLKDYLDAADHHTAGMITAVGVAESPSYPENLTPRPHPDYSCYMIAKWAHQRIPFDEAYDGAYLEDADHHVRMFRAGIWAGSINLGFKHYSSGTLKFADEQETNRINRHYQRNKARFLAEYGCVPGTKGYERLFLESPAFRWVCGHTRTASEPAGSCPTCHPLPAQGSPNVARDAEQLQQPDYQ